MKILYIHQYFKTPREPGGTRSYWIAKELIKNGHEVVMLTTGDKMLSHKDRKDIDGIDVIYVKVPYSNNMGILKRLQSFIRFMIKSSSIALKEKDVDLVISTSTPLTVGVPALILKAIKKKPFLFEVRDLWPEVPIQMGGLKNPLLIRIVTFLEKLIYKNALHIVTLSPGMTDGVKKVGILDEKISMIPNMSKIDEFWPREKNLNLCISLGLNTKSFKIVHFGALGIANGAMTIIESAKLLKDNANIEFIFIGGGSTEETLKSECEKSDLKNVHFLGAFPMSVTSDIVNLCDMSIVSFLNLPILYTNSPNKLFDSLSAGKAIIVNSAGWTKALVEDNKCGVYVNPIYPKELSDKLLELSSAPEIVVEMGKAARHLAETKYDKSILCKQFNDVVSSLNMRNNV